ncbi:hypothetical protein JHD50_06900 [Sulfurimonas sp. MAG313]|nr:hypothetical protein [Sulfurimonas sp. MAG313]MDF1881034.1 hypothetical protein [Sulfurimonas sp. MAG313]
MEYEQNNKSIYEDTYAEKNEILIEIKPVLMPGENIDITFLLTTIMLMLLVLLLAFPKIFLQSSIYYKSRDISSLEREYKSLKEEKKIITNEVEQKRFKNQILDTLF